MNSNVPENKMDIGACKALVKKIENGEYDSLKQELVKDLVKMERVQPRAKDRLDHIKDLYYRIKDEGSAKNCKPVVIVSEWGDEEVDQKIGGNHTVEAANKADLAELRTIRIPKEIGNQFNLIELQWIGNALNPLKKIIELSNEIDDMVKLSVNAADAGVNDKERIDSIKELGYNGQRLAVVTRGFNKELNERTKTRPGYTWKNYMLERWKPELKQKVEENIDENTHCIRMSSGNLKVETIFKIATEMLLGKISGNKRNLVVVIYHPHGIAQGSFKTRVVDWQPVFDEFLPYRKINLTFKEMEVWEKDAK